MVGWALFQGIGTPGVPAHRVVNRRGELSGRNNFATPTLMQERLEAEGITIVDDTVQDFATVYWSPTDLLDQ